MQELEQEIYRLVVQLPSELDHHCTEELRLQIDERIKEEPISELEFDFSNTIFMDSAGIGMILGRYKLMKGLSGRIIASHVNAQIEKILALSGIQNYIQLDREDS